MRDPRRDSILTEYPDLPYGAATRLNMALYEKEGACAAVFLKKHKVFVHVWEFGYYFLTRYLQLAVVGPRTALGAGLFAEGHSALRASFLAASRGYQPDAAALLRKTHESFVRAVACSAKPAKALTFIRSQDLGRTESELKLNLKQLYRLESGFAHSNRLRSMVTLTALHERKAVPTQYGPHVLEDLHNFLSKVAIFWLYFGIRTAPLVIPAAPRHREWLAMLGDSSGLLVGYLRDSRSKLVEECDQVDTLADRLGNAIGPA